MSLMLDEDEMLEADVAVAGFVGVHADLDAGMLAHGDWPQGKIELIYDYQVDLGISDAYQFDLRCLD